MDRMTTPKPVGSTRPGPEIIGVVLAAIIYSVVGVAIIAARPSTSAATAPSPTRTAAATARPAATLDAGLVLLIRDADARMVVLGQELKGLLAEPSFVSADVITKIKEIGAAATFADSMVARIQSQPGGAAIAPTLRASYDAIVAAVSRALSVPFRDPVAVRRGAEGVVALLVDMPDIYTLLAAAASASPGPTSEPTAVAAKTPVPKPTPKPSATPQPTATPALTPSPGPPSQLANGGFETGLEPWRLILAPGVAGTFVQTMVDPYAGSASALVTPVGGAGLLSGLSVEQGGLTLESGGSYQVSLAVRSTAAREIRIRLSTTLGEVIASRVLPVTSTWTTLTFPVTPIGRFEDVTLEIEAGGSDQGVWLDDVSLR